MKSIAETDIFANTRDAYKTDIRIKNVASGQCGTRIINELKDSLSSMERTYKDVFTTKAYKDLSAGNIALVYGNPIDMFPPFMPFAKVLSANKTPMVLCDLSLTTFDARKNRTTGEATYSMDIRQLNSILLAAETYLHTDKNTILPPAVIDATAQAWAKMFCKVLNRTIYLNTFPERYQAFNYFAMMYYMINMLEMTPKSAEEFAVEYLKGGKSVMIREIEGNIAGKDLHPYQDFKSFCDVLFDRDVTGIPAIQTTVGGSLNMPSYLKVFISTYDIKSLFALASFPYFMYIYISVNNANRGFNRRIFEDIMVNPKQYATVMAAHQKILD